MKTKNKYNCKIFLAGFFCCALLVAVYYCVKTTNVTLNSDIWSIIEALATVGSLISIWFMIVQFHSDHEKSRREKTVDILLEWKKSITEDTYIIKQLCEKLNEEQCRKLSLLEAFNVEADWYKEFCEIFKDGSEQKKDENPIFPKSIYCEDCSCTKKNDIPLTKAQVKKLRWELTNYLNILEIVMVAWENKIVDTEVIEQEFAFLINKKEGKTLLETFRIAVGDENTYPAIKDFCIQAEKKNQDKILCRSKTDNVFF